jgi:hypothetical protein
MRSTSKIRIAACAALATAAVAVPAGTASALTIPKQISPYSALTLRANMGGVVTFDQAFGSQTIQGKADGVVTYNAPIANFKAGCARVKVQWLDGNGNVLANDYSPQACSSNGLVPAAASYSETHSSASIRSVRLRLQVEQFGQTAFTTVATRTVAVGG